MIYIIYQHNQVHKYEVRDENSIIYIRHIYHTAAYKTIYLRIEHTRYLPLLHYCTKVIYIRTNTENGHAQCGSLPGTRKNADVTIQPVEGSE
jgi:hypothetical protein